MFLWGHPYTNWEKWQREIFFNQKYHWYNRKNRFQWAIAADQAGENQENSRCFTWYIRARKESFDDTFTQEVTSLVHFWIGWYPSTGYRGNSYETTSNQRDDSRNILRGFRYWRESRKIYLWTSPHDRLTKMTEMRCTLRIRIELRKRSRIEACPSELLGETRLKVYETLHNRGVQGLDSWKVCDIAVNTQTVVVGVTITEHNDICRRV